MELYLNSADRNERKGDLSMAIATLILGKSGTGKTASLRNLDPNQTLLIQSVKKPLPFKAAGWKPVATDDYQRIANGIHKAKEMGKSIVIIDDFQYVMANEFMRRATEVGFTKFTEIAQHAHYIIESALYAPDDLRVYILAHTESNDLGETKIKTIGKMLDEKISLEGLFSTVLRTNVEAGQYKFSTQNNGNDTVKSPIGLFNEQFIDNDLKEIDQKICEYYGIRH